MNQLLKGFDHGVFTSLLGIAFPQFAISQGLSSAIIFCRCSGPLLWRDIGCGAEFTVLWSFLTLLSSSAFYGFCLLLIVVNDMTGFEGSRIRTLMAGRRRDFFSGDGTVLSAQGLTKCYGNSTIAALSEVTFTVERGSVIGVIGSNGSGKSTLIGVVCGTIKADSGSISLFERTTNGFDDLRECCGVCFQENVLIPELTVGQHFILFGTVRGMNPSLLRPRVSNLESALELEEVRHIPARDLSGGQRRKLCVALALLSRPPIIILDEPTAGVDIRGRLQIWKIIGSDCADSVTLVTVHGLEEAESVCSQLFLLRSGRVGFYGTGLELRQRCHCGYLLRVFGEGIDRAGFSSFLTAAAVGAREVPSTHHTFVLPSDTAVVSVLDAIGARQAEFGIEDFTVDVQSLEDVVVKFTETDDESFQWSV
jgi:ABC-type multidrug transport system ATPase subunit